MTKLGAHEFDYPLMEPRFEVKAFEDMSRREAQEYFDWFVSQCAARRDLLIRAVKALGGPAARLDYSPKSLVALWETMIPEMRTEKPSPKELAAKLAAAPAWVHKANIGFAELTTGTKCLCVDIGFYVAQVLIGRCPELRWALWKKKTGPYNKPFVDGFRAPFVPSDLVGGCAWSVVKGNRDGSLLRAKVEVWMADLE